MRLTIGRSIVMPLTGVMPTSRYTKT